MKLCRFNDQRFGIVEGETIRDVSGALSVLPARHYPLPTFDTMVAAIDEVRAAAESVTAAPTLRLDEVTLLSPVANPGKLVAAPVNYQAHLDEAIADEATLDIITDGEIRREIMRKSPARLPDLLLPKKGRFGLIDYEKIFCADVLSGQDIFDMRGIDRKNGCIVIVRPDQYVAPCPAPKRHCRPLGVLRRIHGGSEPRLKGAARRTANPCTPIRLLRGK
jgi:Domain of unknown function (DUF2437)